MHAMCEYEHTMVSAKKRLVLWVARPISTIQYVCMHMSLVKGVQNGPYRCARGVRATRFPLKRRGEPLGFDVAPQTRIPLHSLPLPLHMPATVFLDTYYGCVLKWIMPKIVGL